MRNKRRSFGCIQRIKKETYRLRWTDAGRRKSETVYGSRADAEKRMSEIHTSVDQTRPRMMTIAEIYETLVLPENQRKLAQRTLDNDKRRWNRHIEPMWGSVYVDEIKAGDVQKWLLTLPQNVAAKSLTTLRAVMRHAVMLELIDHSPVDITFEMPKETAYTLDKSIITSSDIDKYYDAVKDTNIEAAFILGACAGLRPGEMLGVKVGEVEYVDGVAVVDVMREIDEYGHIVLDSDGQEQMKTEQSRRYAVIYEPYASRLVALQNTAEAHGNEFLTTNSRNKPIGVIELRETWYAILEKNNLDKILLRNLRPTFATAMHHEYGMQTEDIARLLGHSKPIITYETYERPNKEDIIKTANKVNKMQQST